jgi:hypothetical protein
MFYIKHITKTIKNKPFGMVISIFLIRSYAISATKSGKNSNFACLKKSKENQAFSLP